MSGPAAFKKSSFAPAFLFLSRPRRRALAALYAFARAVDDAVDDAPPPEAERTLALWRAVLSAPYVEDRAAAPPQWPALEEALRAFPIDKRHLLDLVDGVARDLAPFRASTEEDFRAYCHGVASTVGLACLAVFGLDEESHKDFAVRLGWAVQTVNVLRDVREDALRGRVYLPQEDLRRFGVAEADLSAPSASPAVLRLLRFEAARAEGYFRDAYAALPPLSRRAARPALLMGRLYEVILEKMKRGDFLWGAPRPRLSWREKARVLLKAWMD
jgi:15-cis-phytoene synthase